MTNRCTLAQLRDMTGEQVDDLPLDQIAMLLEDVSETKAALKAADDALAASLTRRFADRADAMRRAAGKMTGRVALMDGDFIIRADLPKRVEWNEEALISAERQLAEMGEPVGEYIKVKRTVAESAFERWPSSLRAIFEPARTLGVGRASFTIERKETR